MSDGADTQPAERVRLCTKRPWCTLDHYYDGACHEFAREKHAPADFGPKYRRRAP